MNMSDNNYDQFDEMVKGLTGTPMKLRLDDDEGDLFGTATDLSKFKGDTSHDDLLEEEEKEEKTEDVEEVKEEIQEEEEVEVDDEEEDVEEVKESKPSKKPQEKVDKEESTTDDLGEYEADIAKFVAEKLSTKLGEDLGEFEKVEDIIDKLAEIVETSSTPEFANEEVEKIDQYVRDGGDLKKYYSEMYEASVNVDDLELDDVNDQKRIIKQNLKNSGYSDTQIKKKLERYEDAGVLQEEAEEAVELVKEYNEKKGQKLLEEQQNLRKGREKQQQKFISDVQSTIKDLKDIAGIPISDTQKKELMRYLLVFGKDGKTAYQAEYDKDMVKNFIVSAFFTKYKDSLLEKAEKKGASSLAKELQQKFAQKGKRVKKSVNQSDTSGPDAFELFSKKLRRS